MNPTSEQQAALDVFSRGDSFVLTAGAGTGKTTTLRLLAESAPSKRGLYVAFNNAIAAEARTKFPKNITVKTTHALAMAGTHQQYLGRLRDPRIPNHVAARRLGIDGPFRLDLGRQLRESAQASLAVQAVRSFCSSDDAKLTAKHVPYREGLTDEQHHALAQHLLPFAETIWLDLSNPRGDQFRFEHDVYLKVWALTRPTWRFDFILFDEAQDSTPVVTAMVQDQLERGAQLVAVGDSSQAIYGWRGAKNAMNAFNTPIELPLTQSFRFGEPFAKEANKWLTLIGARLRLTGNPERESQVVDQIAKPDAVLCRTNAGVISRLITALSEGVKVAVVGGGGDLLALARAARDLKSGRRTDHPELALFEDWEAVKEYVEDGDAPDLKALVKLIDEHGPDEIERAIKGAIDEASAELTVSTAHKAKGREWASVALHNDFAEPRETPEGTVLPGKDELMLSYVAVTRSMEQLDRGNLSWIDSWAAPTAGGDAQHEPSPDRAENAPQQETPVQIGSDGSQWTAGDDEQLLGDYARGSLLLELTRRFGRGPGAIIARISLLLDVKPGTELFDLDGVPLVAGDDPSYAPSTPAPGKDQLSEITATSSGTVVRNGKTWAHWGESNAPLLPADVRYLAMPPLSAIRLPDLDRFGPTPIADLDGVIVRPPNGMWSRKTMDRAVDAFVQFLEDVNYPHLGYVPVLSVDVPSDIGSLAVDDLGTSRRARIGLRSLGARVVADLQRYRWGSLMNEPGLGRGDTLEILCTVESMLVHLQLVNPESERERVSAIPHRRRTPKTATPTKPPAMGQRGLSQMSKFGAHRYRPDDPAIEARRDVERKIADGAKGCVHCGMVSHASRDCPTH